MAFREGPLTGVCCGLVIELESEPIDLAVEEEA